MAKDDFGKQFKKIVKERVDDFFKDIPRYVIEIGVWSGEEKDTRYEFEKVENKKGELVNKAKTDKNDAGEKVKVVSGITNAEIMFIMENGSDVNNIPARPVLELTIKYAKENLVKQAVQEGVKQYLINRKIESFEKELAKMCVRMENYAKTGIRRNTLGLEPNSQYTINMKGSNLPLLDTGQLANSIRCKYRKL